MVERIAALPFALTQFKMSSYEKAIDNDRLTR